MNKEIEFEEILKNIPETPLCEKGKQLADFEGSWIKFVKLAIGVEKLQKLEAEKCSLKDIKELGEAIRNKIGSYELDGKLKEIDSHKNLENISFANAEVVSELSIAFYEEITKYNVATATKEQTEKVSQMLEELNEKCLEIQNLDTSEMNEWEKGLLVEKIKAMAKGEYESPVGKN